ncbi:MAG: LptF/LptG family permease [Elusimicrobiota bacterium]
MVRILHRYVLLEFLKMFFMMLVLICLLFFVSEFFFRLDEFVRFKASLAFILKYMGVLPPMWLRDGMPAAVFASVVFALSKLKRNGEITAIKGCGINVYNFVLPVIYFSVLTFFISLWLNMNLVPSSFQISRVLRENVMKNNVESPVKILEDLTFRCSDGWLYVFGFYNPQGAVMLDVVASKGATESIVAKKMVYEKDRWVMYDAIARQLTGGHRNILSEKYHRRIELDLTERPADFIPASADLNEMNNLELYKHIYRLKNLGIPHSKEVVAYHLRFSFPFANVVVVFLGIPLALGLSGKYEKVKGIGFTLGLVFLYWVLVSFGSAAGGSGGFIPPFVGAWLANIIFLTAGAFILL